MIGAAVGLLAVAALVWKPSVAQAIHDWIVKLATKTRIGRGGE